MTGRDDIPPHEGQDHYDDGSLQEAADRVRQVMRAPVMRPAFRDRLRSQVVAARAEVITERARLVGEVGPNALPPARRRFVPRRPAAIAWTVATAVSVAAGVIVVNGTLFGNGPVSVAALSSVAGAVSVNPAQAVRIRFTGPLDHAAALAALHLAPAVAVRASWQGSTLTVAPIHGFAQDAAYVITIDRNVARTASGAPLAADIHVFFGTSAVVSGGRVPAGHAMLARSFVAAAPDGSEAVVARDGSLLVTSAQPGPTTSNISGLVRIGRHQVARLAPATDAICVSRSGNSIAFVERSGAGSDVVFADSVGTILRRVPVTVDPGSPLGWIGDAQVSFVGGGRLRSIDRAGHVRILSDMPIDAAHDSITISPGGRYIYVQPATGGPGRLIDLPTGAFHTLPGIVGQPAFSSDGATVIWVEESGRRPRIATAASGGGPVLTARLPVRPGEQVSNLSVAPDGSRFVYSVTRAGHRAELRLAALPGGQTLAISTDGAGQSPDWSPSGHMFTVHTDGPAGPHIDAISIPTSLDDLQAALEATVTRFADAQISGDTGAQRALTAAKVTLPKLPRPTRFAVLWVLPAAHGTGIARVSFTIDPRSAHPIARQAEETLVLGPQPGTGLEAVRSAIAAPLRPAPAGPQLVHLDTRAVPGAVLLTFDSDLDPASLASAISLATPDGAQIRSTATYDPATRTVTLRPVSPVAGDVLVRIGAGLRDINGRTMSAGLQILVPQLPHATRG
jgi:hypothetical protein